MLASWTMSAVVKVLAFAGARDVIGAAELDIEIDKLGDGAHVTVADVVDAVCARFPDLVRYRPIMRMALNSSYVDDSMEVSAGDEIALIPPVAGG